MSKYRIYKRQEHYIVKKKKWFFWRTIKDTHVDVIGGYFEKDMMFLDLESAHNFVEKKLREKNKDLLVAEYNC